MSFHQGPGQVDTAPAPVGVGPQNDSGAFNATPQSATATTPTGVVDREYQQSITSVLQSDIGVTTLLNRLKQSTTAARDFSAFLKERCVIEEKHASGLKKLSRTTHEFIRRPDSRQGSFAQSYEDITRLQDRIGDHGILYSNALFTMAEELQDLASHAERGRKHWKQTGLNAEKRVVDAELAMEKAKMKYWSLAEQYDRTRTGERSGGVFNLKTKSPAQQEEDLQRKVEQADGDYAAKVQAAQTQRQELQTTHRPQAVNALRELIGECDAGLSMQIQKFAALTEKHTLGNGLVLNPLQGQADGTKSLRQMAQNIDNQRDLNEYVSGFTNKAGTSAPEIKYEKHPALMPRQQYQNPQSQQYQGLQSQQSYGPGQPQYPQPQQANPNYGSYGQRSGSNQFGQISGVMPYQSAGTPAPGPRSAYSTDSQPNIGQTPSYSGSQAPQLPQIGALGANTPTAPDVPQGNKRISGSSLSSHEQVTMPHHSQSNNYTNGPRAASGPQPSGDPGYPDNRSQTTRPGDSGPASRGPSFGSAGDFNPAVPGAGVAPQFNGSESGSGLGRGMGGGIAPSVGRGEYQQGAPMGRGAPPGQAPGTGPLNGVSQVDWGMGPRPSSQGRGMGPGPQNGVSSPQGQGLPSQAGAFGQMGRGMGAQPGMPIQGLGKGPTHGAPILPPRNIGPAGGGNAPQGRDMLAHNGAPGQMGRGTGPQTGGPVPHGQGMGPSADSPNSQGQGMTAARSALDGVAGTPSQGLLSHGTGAPGTRGSLPPNKRVFGVSLDELFRRDGSAVPAIVFQCVQAVELFGLDTEGLYRTSGSAPHIMEMKALFDHDSSQVDFRQPSKFHNDIASVTTLLKHFLRDLPDPLLTSAQYSAFIQAAKIDDDIVRRDSLHAIINALPDPNYATLRILTLHLNQVAKHSNKNRMTPNNLAICFGPTLLRPAGAGGQPGNGDIKDAGWQARAVQTILENTFQIFDDDE